MGLKPCRFDRDYPTNPNKTIRHNIKLTKILPLYHRQNDNINVKLEKFSKFFIKRCISVSNLVRNRSIQTNLEVCDPSLGRLEQRPPQMPFQGHRLYRFGTSNYHWYKNISKSPICTQMPTNLTQTPTKKNLVGLPPRPFWA